MVPFGSDVTISYREPILLLQSVPGIFQTALGSLWVWEESVAGKPESYVFKFGGGSSRLLGVADRHNQNEATLLLPDSSQLVERNEPTLVPPCCFRREKGRGYYLDDV